jgi:hypothetical protein
MARHSPSSLTLNSSRTPAQHSHCGLTGAGLSWGPSALSLPDMLRRPRHHRLHLGWLWAAVAAANTLRGAALPSIEITNLPPYGSFQDLGGRVLHADPQACRVAVFIYVPVYGWYSKPTCAQPLTPIQPDGSWSADITTGGTDETATRVAALLVGTNYSEACVTGLPFLPTNIYSQALASAVVTRPHPGVRWLQFSGDDWWVKASTNPVGPGPNIFSDNTNNVWVDDLGRLHLRITHRSNEWQCAEIVSARSFGYGTYRFGVDSPLDRFDTNIVLGLFTWSDDPAYAYREIDVEGWCRNPAGVIDGRNLQFVVQPWSLPNHLVRFALPADMTNSTHEFTWQSGRVAFHSVRGNSSPPPDPGDLLKSWVYAQEVPQTGDENVRLNLWLILGQPPGNGQEAEVIVRSFEHLPPDTVFRPLITSVSLSGTNLLYGGTYGVANGIYRLQAATHLSLPGAEWLTVATNQFDGDGNFRGTNAVEAGRAQRFYRLEVPPP